MGKGILYTAYSKEEYSRLETAMEKFLKSYNILTESPLNVEVRTGFDNCVMISSHAGQITEVQYSKERKNPEGKLERLSPKYKLADIRLGDILFQINFSSPTS